MNFLIQQYGGHWNADIATLPVLTLKSREREVLGYSGSGGLFSLCLLYRSPNLGHAPRGQGRHWGPAFSQFYPQSCKYPVYSMLASLVVGHIESNLKLRPNHSIVF